MEKRKAILVVSFGTSYNETRKKTIDKIEQDIAEAYPDYKIYRAFTSKIIIKKLKARDGFIVPTVAEAMEQITADKNTELIIQPTHMINGIENDIMKQDILPYADQFSVLQFGAPLLTSTQDQFDLIKAVMDTIEKEITDDTAVVLMGHGTTHHANAVYAALDYSFKKSGYENVFIGTVEAYPDLDILLNQIISSPYKKALLAPLMIVAGDHALNDLAGDDPDSWQSRFEAADIPVTCYLRGLGEYPDIRKLLLAHTEAAIQASNI